ncbi:hypothetical protein EB241_01800 [Erwinia psidii]|uniref:Uncharacterized protein n=1 Tax=Erwinia psidii TaxID=69224 RepID=A0A3N6V4K0_9GAMM|nr:hypothetical protein EB241_01800 [Erwinia psidii]
MAAVFFQPEASRQSAAELLMSPLLMDVPDAFRKGNDIIRLSLLLMPAARHVGHIKKHLKVG